MAATATGAAVGAADALFAALFSLYYVGKSQADYYGDYADYNKILHAHFKFSLLCNCFLGLGFCGNFGLELFV